MLCCLVAASKARFMPKLRVPVSVLESSQIDARYIKDQYVFLVRNPPI